MPDFETTAKARLAQFRDHSPTISAAARAPTDHKGAMYRHLLALGYERENLFPILRRPGGASEFFRERGIHWWKAIRSGDVPGPDYPTRNLASSQVCCVNFLLPLAKSPGPLETLLSCIDSDEKAIASIAYSNKGSQLSSRVEFEWVGLRQTLEGTSPQLRGAHATSADALILADLRRGGRRAYVIEWKFVEKYRPDHYLGDGTAGATRLLRYSPRYVAPSSVFRRTVPIEEWLFEPLYQILRLLLLGHKMVEEQELGVTEASVVVICPSHNTAYLNRITSPGFRNRFTAASTIEQAVHSALLDNTHFKVLSQEELLSSVANRHAADLKPWIAYHHERYGWGGNSLGAK